MIRACDYGTRADTLAPQARPWPRLTRARVRLTFYIPGFLDRVLLAPDEATPALSGLVASAPARIEPDGALAFLAPHYGVEKQHDWPLAPLRLAAVGVDTDARYWLCATPVTLEAGLDDVRIVRAADDLDRQDADALIAALAKHFAQDGLTFAAPRPNDWYAGCAMAPDLHTQPLLTVIGRALRAHLPVGADAALWRRWQQEMEMLLHRHPVNSRREQEGLTIVNGVWLQHGGRMPGDRSVPRVHTASDDPDLCALARHIRADAQPCPRDADAALRQDAARVVMSAAVDLSLRELDGMFAAPMLRALQSRGLEEIELIGDGLGKPAVRWRCTRVPLLRRLMPRTRASLADAVTRAVQAGQ